MQPSPSPQRSLARASRAALLLGLAALSTAPSADAWVLYCSFTNVCADVQANADPDSGQVSASACLQHDSMWPNPVPVYQETDDEGVTVWVAAGTDESAGSEKASTSCVTSGYDLPGGNP